MTASIWPFHGYAPGCYFCVCATCETEFTGDKRCVTCAECAIKRSAAAPTPPKVGSGELDAAGVSAAVKALADYCDQSSSDVRRVTFAIRAYLALAAPVDHPEVVGELRLALAKLTDAFLNRHGCFPLDRTNGDERVWNAAMLEAYRLIGQPQSPERIAALQSSDSPALEVGVATKSLHPKVPGQAAAGDPLDWAVYRWHDEVANRPLINVHRRSLDDTWRQVIRHFGGDPVELCGPAHDDLLEASRALAIPEKEDGK